MSLCVVFASCCLYIHTYIYIYIYIYVVYVCFVVVFYCFMACFNVGECKLCARAHESISGRARIRRGVRVAQVQVGEVSKTLRLGWGRVGLGRTLVRSARVGSGHVYV